MFRAERVKEKGYNWTLTTFEDTQDLPTYLFAFVVADFKCMTGTIDTDRLVAKSNVCARPEFYDQLGYAFNVSIDTLVYFSSLFNSSSTTNPFLRKIYHYALPDFTFCML